MKEAVAIAKETDAKKGFSPAKDNSIYRLRNEPERQLGSLRGVIGNITRDGGTPSVDSIATELSSMHTAQRASTLLALQRTHGNRYVQRVVAGIQAKLKVGQPGDIYEQEADRVADAVMRMSEPQVQRQPEEEKKKEEEGILQTKEVPSQTPEVTNDLESRIQSLKGGGQPLPESVRAYFEPRFGYDFSQVQLHKDLKAAEIARSVNACAFTTGNNIVFGADQYAPGTVTGRRLLAHELTHVIQQRISHPTAVLSPISSVSISFRSGTPPMVARQIDVEETVDRLERENRAPKDLTASEAADIGEEAMRTVSYEEIVNIALEAGFLERKETNQGGATVQQQLMPLKNTIFREAATATFGLVFARYAITAGIVSQIDPIVPGPGDVVGLGILVVGLAAAGYAVYMASHGRGNVADTGIIREVQGLIEAAIDAGTTLTVCQALAQLLEAAQRNRDAQRIRRIDRTQKARGCRHAR